MSTALEVRAKTTPSELQSLERLALACAKSGYFKDASSYYLHHFPQWQLITAESEADIDATRLRRILFEAEDMVVSLEVMSGLVPLAVRRYLIRGLTAGAVKG